MEWTFVTVSGQSAVVGFEQKEEYTIVVCLDQVWTETKRAKVTLKGDLTFKLLPEGSDTEDEEAQAMLVCKQARHTFYLKKHANPGYITCVVTEHLLKCIKSEKIEKEYYKAMLKAMDSYAERMNGYKPILRQSLLTFSKKYKSD